MKDEPRWAVLARVEDEDSLFPPAERLDPAFFRAMVESYDSDFRKAPVISGYDPKTGTAGPAHWVGENLAPLGFVRALNFDGLNLWGQIEEINGRVTDAVANGFLQRSIGFWRRSPEVDGRPYLRHFALFGGEQPGIPNLPPLDQYFSADAGEVQGRIVASAPYQVRSILNNVEEVMDEKVLDVLRDLTDAVNSLKETRSVETPKEAPPEESRAPSHELTQLRSDLDEVKSMLGSVIEVTKSSNAEARGTVLDGALSKLVSQGRLTPADKESEFRFITKLDPKDQEERIADLQTRSPILTERLTQRFETVEGQPEVRIDRRQFTFPNQQKVDARSLQFHKEALGRSKNGADMKAYVEAAYALHGESAPAFIEGVN